MNKCTKLLFAYYSKVEQQSLLWQQQLLVAEVTMEILPKGDYNDFVTLSSKKHQGVSTTSKFQLNVSELGFCGVATHSFMSGLAQSIRISVCEKGQNCK